MFILQPAGPLCIQEEKKMMFLAALLAAAVLVSAQVSWNQSVLEDFTCMCIYQELERAKTLDDDGIVFNACYARLIANGPVDDDTVDRFSKHFMDVFNEMYFAYYVDNFA
jgi:hypothetical protein